MRRVAKIGVGIVIAAGLLWLLFRNTTIAELWDAVRRQDIRWLLASQIAVALGVVVRVQRWDYIVRPVQPVSFRHLLSATQIGYTANFVLPFRLGEIVRALTLTRLTGIAVAKAVALAAMDRVADLFGMAIVMAIAAFAMWNTADLELPRETLGLPKDVVFSAAQVRAAAAITGGLVVVAIPVMAALYLNQARALQVIRAIVGRISRRFADWSCRLLTQAAGGLMVFESGRALAMALAMTLVTWASYLLATQCLVYAFHIQAPWFFAFAQIAILGVGISVPSTPGLLGQYQVPIVVALSMLVPGLPDTQAKAFALVSYFALEAPVVLLGVICLALEKLNLFELTAETPNAPK
ncbi:MAG: flippase-like domain-containing protein [Candidatus Hydrogenedentes bacterium]|nr:flippase-like domain-containing protein [Candidatus Hydrogenedentota bacterium]